LRERWDRQIERRDRRGAKRDIERELRERDKLKKGREGER
jgi:hypothetical protein